MIRTQTLPCRRGLLGAAGAAAVVLCAVFAVATFAPARASADSCSQSAYPTHGHGRQCGYGYFSNHYQVELNKVLHDGITASNAQQFTSALAGHLQCRGGKITAPLDPQASRQNATGSAFIILLQLGYKPGTDKNVACQQFDRWKKLIFAYQDAGLIKWHKPYTGYQFNSGFQYYHNDDTMYVDPEPSPDTILFFNPDGSGEVIFAIAHTCANVEGEPHKLPPVNPPSNPPSNPPPPVTPPSHSPYFTVEGGDVKTGAGMAVNTAGGSRCAVGPDPKAGIVSWNRGAAHGYGGAGTGYAALALGHLQGFVTGQGGAYQPSGLSFANTGQTVQTSGGLYGGEFGGLSCVPNYFAYASNVHHGPETIHGQSVRSGEHRTIYVDGDVYITGDIVFSGSNSGYGSSLKDIPSFVVVAKGNIYISPNVKRLDGLYVAEPTKQSKQGVIYDCASGLGKPAPLDGSLYHACHTSLTVNGAFISRQLRLERTAGDVKNGAPAESFHFTPEVWMSTPFNNQLNAPSQDTYDAITSLPPVL